MMKKLIALIALTTAFGVYADDSYLYWMVGGSVSRDNEAFSDYSYAKVGVLNDGSSKFEGYLSLFGEDQSSLGRTSGRKGSSFYANLANYGEAGYSFYIELFNDQNVSVGRSTDILKYSDALAFATSFGTDVPKVDPWTPTAFTTAAVPEPSSALLMLLGCAGLALKRKKQAKA